MRVRCRGASGEQDALRFVHAASLVGDVDRRGVGGLAYPYDHRAAAVPRSVVDEHGEHLAHSGGRGACHGRPPVDRQAEVAALEGQASAPLRRHFVEQRHEVERFCPLRPLTAGEGEQFLDGRLQAVHVHEALADRGAEVPVRLFERRFQAKPYARERCAQLVRGVRGEGALPREQIIEAAGRAVEGGGDRIDLRYPAPPDTDAEIPFTETTRSDGQVLQRARQPPGLPAPDEPGRGHGQCRKRAHRRPREGHLPLDGAARRGGLHRPDHITVVRDGNRHDHVAVLRPASHPAGEGLNDLGPAAGRRTATQQRAVGVVHRHVDGAVPADVADRLRVVDVTGHDDRDGVRHAPQLVALGLQSVLEHCHRERHAEQGDGQRGGADGETDDSSAHSRLRSAPRAVTKSGTRSACRGRRHLSPGCPQETNRGCSTARRAVRPLSDAEQRRPEVRNRSHRDRPGRAGPVVPVRQPRRRSWS